MLLREGGFVPYSLIHKKNRALQSENEQYRLKNRCRVIKYDSWAVAVYFFYAFERKAKCRLGWRVDDNILFLLEK